MSPKEIVAKMYADIEAGAINESDYADDLVFEGPTPQPLNKQQYLAMMHALTKAIPNWKFNRGELVEADGTVSTTFEITGTQTGTLSGLMPGMPDIPATNKSFRLPPEHAAIHVRGNQVDRMLFQVPPDGGVPGLLRQIGVELSQPA